MVFFSCLPNCNQSHWSVLSLCHLHLHKTGWNSSPHWRPRSVWVFQQEVCHIQQCSGASQKSTNFSVDVQNATLSVMKSHFLQLWTWPQNINLGHDLATRPWTITAVHNHGTWPWNMIAEHDLQPWPRNMISDNDLGPWPQTITAVNYHATWPWNMTLKDDFGPWPGNITSECDLWPWPQTITAIHHRGTRP